MLAFAKDRFGESQVLDWPEKKLRQSLLDGLKACPCNVCIFVDGLDEYEGNMLDLFKILVDIDDSCGSLPHAVKLCLASRPEPLLNATLQESAGFRMQDHNFKGIQQYVHATLKCVRTVKGDEAFTNLSSEIAERSEGVFLWARLAMNDVIDGHGTGDTQGELLERLKRVPRDLRDLYSRIFMRLTDELKDEANTILLLVCGAKRTLALQELYIAVKLARKEDLHDEDDNEHVGLPLELLKAFRRRVLARTGGLLEIADRNSLEGSSSSEDASNDAPKKIWEVKLIHETVRPFIESNQGHIFCPPSLDNTAAPRSLWLGVCVRSIQEALPATSAVKLQVYETATGRPDLWSDAMSRMKQQFPLVVYALLFLFDHARDVEMLDGLSSYKSLKNIMIHNLCRLHERTAMEPFNSHCVWCDGRISFGEISSTISSSEPSWLWAAVHGLAKYCTSAFAEENRLDTDDGSILEYAMNIYKSGIKVEDSHLKANLATVALLVEHNILVDDDHIAAALRAAPPQVLNLLLRDYSPGRKRLKDYDGESVGPFWRLMYETYQGSYFRRTVDNLLRRGESLNGNSEPAGTVLHAPLYSLSNNVLWKYELLLKKGADPNIPGPAGTPLQLAWKRVLDGRVETPRLSDYQGLIRLLFDHGALINWVDEDGMAPTEKEIRAFCELHGTKRLAFSKKKLLR